MVLVIRMVYHYVEYLCLHQCGYDVRTQFRRTSPQQEATVHLRVLEEFLSLDTRDTAVKPASLRKMGERVVPKEPVITEIVLLRDLQYT